MDTFEKYYNKLEEEALTERVHVWDDEDELANKKYNSNSRYYRDMMNNAEKVNSNRYDPDIEELQNSTDKLGNQIEKVKAKTNKAIGKVFNVINQQSDEIAQLKDDINNIEDYITKPENK